MFHPLKTLPVLAALCIQAPLLSLPSTDQLISIAMLRESGENFPAIRNGMLDLSHQNLGSLKGADTIPNSDTITLLRLNNNKLTSVDLNLFKNFEKLTELVLSHNEISEIHAGFLTKLPATVKTLVLSHNAIATLSNNVLRALKSLERLYLDNNPIAQKTKDRIQAALPKVQIFW